MPHPSKRKGTKGEYELRDRIKARGIPARRVPLSGAAPGLPGDLVVGPADDEMIWEVKRRENGFRSLYAWLDGASVVGLRADKREWLVCLRLGDYLDLLEEVVEK